VENLASEAPLDVQFKHLKKSIRALQGASAALDHAKDEALKDLEDWHHRLEKCQSRSTELWAKRFFKKSFCRMKKIIGWEPCNQEEFNMNSCDASEERFQIKAFQQLLVYSSHDVDVERSDAFRPTCPTRKELKEIVDRLMDINKKARAFEKGFISKDGIKDREWYKHLAVAPGKWLGEGLHDIPRLRYRLSSDNFSCLLGYGATTFPGLTEAIVYDKNSTRAQYEAKRLEDMINVLAKKIKI